MAHRHYACEVIIHGAPPGAEEGPAQGWQGHNPTFVPHRELPPPGDPQRGQVPSADAGLKVGQAYPAAHGGTMTINSMPPGTQLRVPPPVLGAPPSADVSLSLKERIAIVRAGMAQLSSDARAVYVREAIIVSILAAEHFSADHAAAIQSLDEGAEAEDFGASRRTILVRDDLNASTTDDILSQAARDQQEARDLEDKLAAKKNAAEPDKKHESKKHEPKHPGTKG